MRLAKGIKRRVPRQMNRLESAWCEQIRLRQHAGEIAWWKFEGIALKLADDTRYTPDFMVQLPDGTLEAHEVKGRTKKPARKVNGVKVRPEGTIPYVEGDAKVKLSVFAEAFPFRCVVAFCGGMKDSWSFKEVG